MFAWPPWMRTNSGYFFAGSNDCGSATKLCTRRPWALVNQNSSSGGQSRAEARAVLTEVSGLCVLATGSMRTISVGLVDDPQPAITTGAAADVGTWIPLTTPRDSRTGVTAPPRSGIVYRRTNPESSAVRYSERLSGVKAN